MKARRTRKQPDWDRRVVLIFSGKLLLAGPFVLILGLWGLIEGSLSHRWPTTTGLVTTCFCHETAKLGGSDHRLELRYSYRVDGIDREGREVNISYAEESADWIHERTMRYPAGKRVTVFYNSDDHDESILEPGFAVSSLWFLFLGIAAIGGGIALLRDQRGRGAKPELRA